METASFIFLPDTSPLFTRSRTFLVFVRHSREKAQWVAGEQNFFSRGKASADKFRPILTASWMASVPWKEGLFWGSWLQHCCIKSVSSSKPGVSGPDGGSSVSGGRICLSHTASRTNDVWDTTRVGVCVRREGIQSMTATPSWKGVGSVGDVRREWGSLSR